MSFSLAFALQAAWAPTRASTADSIAVAAIFVEGCLQGSLKLPISRGEVLPKGVLPDFVERGLQLGGESNLKIVKFREPTSTYLVLADVDKPGSRGFVKTCLVMSSRLNLAEAIKALMVGSEGANPVRSAAYLPRWTIDRPELGYLKRVTMEDNRSLVLEYSTYASRAK